SNVDAWAVSVSRIDGQSRRASAVGAGCKGHIHATGGNGFQTSATIVVPRKHLSTGIAEGDVVAAECSATPVDDRDGLLGSQARLNRAKGKFFCIYINAWCFNSFASNRKGLQ